MTVIIRKEDILSLIEKIDIISSMEKGFISYSNGRAIVPPVGELLFNNPPGETHIKYGYIKDEDYFCIKIASGFYDNPKLGISSSQGIMLLFSQKTGESVAVLLDEGHLTNIRTAAAGALVAKYFAPKTIRAIGLIGTGLQARLQLEYLNKVTSCKRVWIWDRSEESSIRFRNEFGERYNISIADSPSKVAKNSNLIVTTTPSTIPLLKSSDILEGTHITAVGSDTAEKQELESTLVQRADMVISDSISQSTRRGEIFRSRETGLIDDDKIIELGRAIQYQKFQRKNDQQITIADLTGVAVQDIMIATAVYNEFLKLNN